MATKKAIPNALAPITGSKSLTNIDAELNAEVANLKNQIGAPAGNKLRLEPSGNFKTPDGMDLGSQIRVVVVDFYSRNFFYSGPYNPNNIVPPDCYALGKDKDSMAPEDDSPNKQNENCKSCPLNAFKSGANGTSKACQNRYWLAVHLIDDENPEAHNSPDAPLYILDLSPSNLRTFEGVVSHVARSLGHIVKAELTVTATPVGTYASLTFSDPMPNASYAIHAARRAEAAEILVRKPDFNAAPAAPQRGRQVGKAPARPVTRR